MRGVITELVIILLAVSLAGLVFVEMQGAATNLIKGAAGKLPKSCFIMNVNFREKKIYIKSSARGHWFVFVDNQEAHICWVHYKDNEVIIHFSDHFSPYEKHIVEVYGPRNVICRTVYFP